jgi:hypothetical protein
LVLLFGRRASVFAASAATTTSPLLSSWSSGVRRGGPRFLDTGTPPAAATITLPPQDVVYAMSAAVGQFLLHHPPPAPLPPLPGPMPLLPPLGPEPPPAHMMHIKTSPDDPNRPPTPGHNQEVLLALLARNKNLEGESPIAFFPITLVLNEGKN